MSLSYRMINCIYVLSQKYGGVFTASLCAAFKTKRPSKRLWTGSGGNIWDLMLRHAVLEVGGEVTGHDHGGGSGAC